MSATPLRHYFAPRDPQRHPDVCRCARPRVDSVHLEPGDVEAMNAAIRAASPHPEPQRTPEQSARAVERAERRNAARTTIGTATTSAAGGGTVTVKLHGPGVRG